MNTRFPISVVDSRPCHLQVPRLTAVLALALAFAGGVTVCVWIVILIRAA